MQQHPNEDDSRLRAVREGLEALEMIGFFVNQPIHLFLVVCLNSCFQETSVRVGLPQLDGRRLDYLCTMELHLHTKNAAAEVKQEQLSHWACKVTTACLKLRRPALIESMKAASQEHNDVNFVTTLLPLIGLVLLKENPLNGT